MAKKVSTKIKKMPVQQEQPPFRFPINIGTFLFGAIFIYMLVSVILYISADHIESYQVMAGPLAKNQTYTALAVRDEQLVKAKGNGYITYYARENTKVSKGGVVYTLGETKSEAALNALSEKDYSTIRSSMAAFASVFDGDEFYKTYNYKNELEGAILQYCGLKTVDGTAQTMGNQTVYTSEQDGIIQYNTDGYEQVNLDEISPELFNRTNYSVSNLQRTREVQTGDTIYKLITDEKWSLLIPLTPEQTVQLAGRETIRVKFLQDGATQNGQFSILTGDNNDFYCKITFSSGLIRYASQRFIDIELVTNVKSGLKIPLESIVTKEFYKIPKDYVTHNENDGTAGFNKKVQLSETESSADFVTVTLYHEDEENYYVDIGSFGKGDVIIKPNSQDTYTIKETFSLEGVYCINKGYAVFRKISIIDQNDEYCIVETGTDYGISQFDYIVRNGETVKEDDILYN